RLPKGTLNPCHQVKKHPEPAGVVRFLDDAERVRLLAACKASSWPRLYLLVLLAIVTGARRSELLGLRWRYIDLERRQARITSTKNGEAKTLAFTNVVAEELAHFRAQDAKRFKLGLAGTLVFHSNIKPEVALTFESLWQQALKAAQVHHFRFHDLRHTCASYLAQNGATLLEVADVLGHKTMAMVKRYAHLTVKSKAALIDRVLGEV